MSEKKEGKGRKYSLARLVKIILGDSKEWIKLGLNTDHTPLQTIRSTLLEIRYQ